MALPGDGQPLDVYDAAVLAGGVPRLVDTALVALVEAGHVRVEPSGEFRAEATSSGHPVEAAVLDAVAGRGHSSVDQIHGRLVREQKLAPELQRLTAAGLVRRATLSRLVRHTSAYTPTAAGRRALRSFAEHTQDAGSNAAQVALHGRETMPDRRLHDEIFVRAAAVPVPRRDRQNSRAVDPGSLGQEDYRTRMSSPRGGREHYGYGGAGGPQGGFSGGDG
ncbi:TIGR04222 domain-containing membrane protein [Blastococcus sp. TML/M2B]|uniref:TIGR04222 domain-containing membrane protein n=1 Tax=unclassified Blastococcus TaxID=2619396 RepID=UPI00190999FC|nr:MULTISPECIES: TIGR04222 domain-containing membrane protein [unclassified Blastococcus]MBN1091527.1 TIGR04222 domain-containing membrane protein [Blastococcus sp. TML/M2B]MBN1094922.1 TIGR04222 domain-containing membrane protein [Blastococcus sp. TML/C7B]